MIINDWDPIGLSPYSSDDEYQYEISEIEKLVIEIKKAKILAKEIYSIFRNAFDNVFEKSQEECLQISKYFLR